MADKRFEIAWFAQISQFACRLAPAGQDLGFRPRIHCIPREFFIT
jgi:hypothetical protein